MDIERKKDLAERLLMKPLSDDARERVEGLRDDVRQQERYVLNDDGYEEYLLAYVKEFDGEGCSCLDVGCPLKDGRVPRRVLEAAEWERELRRWAHNHSGDAAALVKARDDYRDVQSDVERVYSKIIAVARDDLDEDVDLLA